MTTAVFQSLDHQQNSKAILLDRYVRFGWKELVGCSRHGCGCGREFFVGYGGKQDKPNWLINLNGTAGSENEDRVGLLWLFAVSCEWSLGVVLLLFKVESFLFVG